jgi:ABC-type Mn2+/Zn2+ transport system permease subunit
MLGIAVTLLVSIFLLVLPAAAASTTSTNLEQQLGSSAGIVRWFGFSGQVPSLTSEAGYRP